MEKKTIASTGHFAPTSGKMPEEYQGHETLIRDLAGARDPRFCPTCGEETLQWNFMNKEGRSSLLCTKCWRTEVILYI